MKPDYKSYISRQFSKYPYIVKCNKTGYIFKEVNGETHKLNFGYIRISLTILFSLIFLLSLENISKNNFFLQSALIYISVTLFFNFIAHQIYTRILYKISKFEIIDERELVKYPGVIESLKKAELRSKKKNH